MLGKGRMSKHIEVRGDVAVIKDFNPQHWDSWDFNGSRQNLVCDKIQLFTKYLKYSKLIIYWPIYVKLQFTNLYASVYSYIVCLCLSETRERV